MKKNIIKFLILILITKEIVPLNEEYLLIFSFMIFLYLFYKNLVTFFYKAYSSKTDYADYQFNVLYLSEKKSIKLLTRALKKLDIKKLLKPILSSSNIKDISKPKQLLYPLTLPWLYKKTSFANLATFEIVSWFLFEETVYYQNKLLLGIDRLFDLTITPVTAFSRKEEH